MYYVVAIMCVWEEEKMLPLALNSTKDFVTEYIIINKPGLDDTKKVIFECKDKWNLNIKYIESDMKLREARKYCVEISQDYADYYLIQDGDEIYFNSGSTNVQNLTKYMNDNYDFCFTSMILINDRLDLTLKNTTWLVPHPFFFKNPKNLINPEDFIWINKGDLPCLSCSWKYKVKTYKSAVENNPWKFDCTIKNYRRSWLRSVFTAWHDGDNICTIEEYAEKYHHDMIWHKNKFPNITMQEVINITEESKKKILDKLEWHNIYDENKYFKCPDIITKYKNHNLLFGYSGTILD
jgi:hypothetical protein